MFPKMSGEIAKELMVKLAYEYGVVMSIQVLHGKAWIRLSANLHNTKQDYIKMRDRLAEALDIQVLNRELEYIDETEERIETAFINWTQLVSMENEMRGSF